MKKNIFENDKIPVSGEIFNILLKHKNVVIEKILSSNLVPEKEYIQDQDEWVILLKGEANILIDNKNIQLVPGDFIFIKSGNPHKVLKTSSGTTWLSVHIY
ncbi:MAG: cupin domain-containing protein [Spirochaetia bacterium]|nr:cupin domain-containing protein [Spirochaetia bacterium]